MKNCKCKEAILSSLTILKLDINAGYLTYEDGFDMLIDLIETKLPVESAQ